MGGKGAKTQTSTSTSAPPAWLSSAYQDIIKKGNDVYNLPLNQYSGPTLAGFSPDQQAAFSSIRGASGAGQPFFNQAQNYLTSGNEDIWSHIPEFNQANLSNYYSPYENDVVNTTMDDLRRANATQQTDLTGRAIMAGAWGGSGAEDSKMNLAGQQAQNTASTIAGLRNTGFNTASNLFNTDRQSQLQALMAQRQNALNSAGIAGNLGTSSMDNILKQASAQLGTGTQQQALAQQELNIPYEQFQQQQAYPYQQLQYLTNLIAAISGGAGGTSTSSQPVQKSNGLSDILGIAGTVASFLKDGGRVSKAYGGGIAPGPGYMPVAAGMSSPGMDMNFMKASLDVPQPQALSDLPDDTMDKWMRNISALRGMGHGGGKNLISIPKAFGGFSDAMNRGAGIAGGMRAAKYAGHGGFGPFADGGPVDGQDFPPVANQQGFSSLVPGTPVYGFDPAVAASRGTIIPSRIPVPPAGTTPTAPTPAAHPLLYFDNNMGKVVHFNDESEKNSYFSWHGGEPNFTSFYARGGIARPRYASGGIMGRNPYGNSSSFMPQVAAGYNGPGFGPQVPDFSTGYIPDSSFGRASLNTPSASIPGQGRHSDDTMQSIADMVKGFGGEDGAPVTPDMLPSAGMPGSSQFGPPTASAMKAGIGTAGKGFGSHIDEVLGDPKRLAAIAGFASMIGNPGFGFMQNVGQGVRSGLNAYVGAKRSERNAQSEAQKLLLEMEKQKSDDDYRNKTLQQPDYVSVDGEEDIGLLNKKTGQITKTGMKPKGADKPIDAADVQSIEDQALMMIPGTLDGKDISSDAFDAVPNRTAALQAATDTYKKTKDANAAARAYLAAAGINPDTDKYEGGWWGATGTFSPDKAKAKKAKAPPATDNKKPTAPDAKNPEAILQQARAALASGAPRKAVLKRLQDYGIDPGGL